MLRHIFRRKDTIEPALPMVGGHIARVPPGVCVYAIGDIHGRVDLLHVLRRQIEADAQQLTPGTQRVVVYMGDYVDRGLQSAQVIDALIGEPLRDFRSVHLLGNHDAWLLSFLLDPEVGATWLRYGGDVTLHSYGVPLDQPGEEPDYLRHLQQELRRQLPRSHLDFLRHLELSFESGDYLFVHAGIRPGKPIDQQTPDDLLWIREPFLSFDRSFGRVVVHGHTVESEPIVRHNRIGIDTGACWTGRLTCAVLEEGTVRFLSTARPSHVHAG